MKLTQEQIEQAKKLFDEKYEEINSSITHGGLWTFLIVNKEKGELRIETSDNMSIARRLVKSIEEPLGLKQGTVKIIEKEYKTGGDDWGGIYSAW